jgi:putative transposase
MLTDRRNCFPLTITDYATRYLIWCEALASSRRRGRITASASWNIRYTIGPLS